MWGAVHGHWCGTRVWPTKCKKCGAAVYFFSCNCGCRVFFEDLGQPWPIHDCDSSWISRLKRSSDASGAIVVELPSGITITRPPDDFSLDRHIVDPAKVRRHRNKPDPIVAIHAFGRQPLNVIGVLREIHKEANPFRSMRLDESTITMAMLGPIAKEPMGKITVHEPQTTNQTASYTAWIPARLLQQKGLQVTLTVAVSIRCVELIGAGSQWYCDSLELLD